MRGLAMALAVMLLACMPARASEIYAIESGGAAYLVDDAGEVCLGPERAVFEVAEARLYAAGEPGRYGLYDTSGVPVGDGEYEMVGMSNGALIARRDGRFGALDERGAEIVPFEWSLLTPCGHGAFLALDGSVTDDLPDELVLVQQGEKPLRTGVHTLNGLHALRDGRMPFMASDGRCGYVDAGGGVAIPAKWRSALEFEDGAAIVSDGAGYGIIDAAGAVLVGTEYAWMSRGEGIIAAMTGAGRVDVFASDGRTLRFSAAETAEQASVAGGFVAVVSGGASRLYDRDGTCVCQASARALFSAGVNGQVIVSDGDWGQACQWVAGSDGKAVSGLYQRLLPLCSGRYAFLTMQGTEYYSEELDETRTAWDYASLRFGLLDGEGRELLPAVYTEIRAAGADRLLLVDEDGVTFADIDGHTLREWSMAEWRPASFAAGA